jgi:ABC-type sugar transport system substrate-binding protein
MNWRALLLAVAAVAVFVFAGCGDDEGGGGSADTSTEAAGGGGIKVASKTIGVVDYARSSPADDSVDDAMEAAGKALGWKVDVVDAGGDAQKFARAASAFVTKNVNALVSVSAPSAVARAAFQRAKSKDIPVLQVAGGVGEDELFDAQYVEDEKKMAQQLIDHILKENPNAKIGNLTATIITAGKDRDDVLKAAVKATATAKIIASAEPDLTDPVGSGRKVTTDMLTGHPEIDTVWAVFDNFSQAALTAIRGKRSDAKLYSFFGTPQHLKNLRSNTPLQAVSDVNLNKTGLVGLDALVQFFEKKTPIDPAALDKNPLQYKVVTKDNVPAEGQATFPLEEQLKPFTDKWAQEFPS